MKKSLCSLFAFTALFLSAEEKILPLPTGNPFLETKQTIPAKLSFCLENRTVHTGNKSTILKTPIYRSGNKYCRLSLNTSDRYCKIQIYIDDVCCGVLSWWGSNRNGYGWPFKSLPEKQTGMEFDEKNGITRIRKPYLTNDGKEAVFVCTLTPLANGRLSIDWNSGSTNSSTALWYSNFKNYKGKKVRIGDKMVVESAEGRKTKFSAAGDVVFHADNPQTGFRISSDKWRGTVQESSTKTGPGRYRYDLSYQGRGVPGKGNAVIDFGNTAGKIKTGPPPVGGIDFWREDGIEIPSLPVRNIFPNPSFEQGFRYWKWWLGGAFYTPSKKPRYEIVPQGLFGKNALLIRSEQLQSLPLASFPLPLEDGQVYTLSFYGKADRKTNIKMCFISCAKGGKYHQAFFLGDGKNPEASFLLTPEWKRFSRTFTADGAGIEIVLAGGGNNTLIDAIQLEKGTQPTPFVSSPVEGVLLTSDPDNAIERGKPVQAQMRFTGKPETRGSAVISIKNPYGEILHSFKTAVNTGKNGIQDIPLGPECETLGEGIFAVKVSFQIEGFPPYFDYYRFDIMPYLSNTHPTKNLFGLSLNAPIRVHRGKDLFRKYMQWGFGATSWLNPQKNIYSEMLREYKFMNFACILVRRDPFYKTLWGMKTHPEKITPEMEKDVEERAYKFAKDADISIFPVFTFYNEEESFQLPASRNFDEWAKLQLAVYRGCKRANPNIQVMPTCGTAGFNALRGQEAMKGYLTAAAKKGIRYDAVGVHPYWNIDQGTFSGYDRDAETARLLTLMDQCGYKKETPVYYTESFNLSVAKIPQWSAHLWQDDYNSGKVGYDFGNHEFIHAASAARSFIIDLKYWPRVGTSNMWVSPFIDVHLSPWLMSKAVNTLGNRMPWVRHCADVRPAAGIRGYVFRLKNGSGIAAVWTNIHDVENGRKRGPMIQVKFGQKTRFFDMMGAERSAMPDASGVIRLPLTPAPLYIEAENPEMLAKSLKNAVCYDAVSAVKTSFLPLMDGGLAANIKNQTGHIQAGELTVGTGKYAYSIPPAGEINLTLKNEKKEAATGKMYRFEKSFSIQSENGKASKDFWKMDYFFVPRCGKTPDWTKIPFMEMKNIHVENANAKRNINFSGKYKMAWNKNNLFLRIEAKDDQFVLNPNLWKKDPKSKRSLYRFDGSLEIYIDCGANGRANQLKTYDEDDYRYDFAPPANGLSGRGNVWRLYEVNWQFAGGVSMPSKEDASRNIGCEFERTKTGYAYTITFPKRYLEPVRFRPGSLFGFALSLRDLSNLKDGITHAVTTATESGSACNYKPHVWPLAILTE